MDLQVRQVFYIDLFRRAMESGETISILCVLGKILTGPVAGVGPDWYAIADPNFPGPIKMHLLHTVSMGDPVTIALLQSR